MAEIKEIFDSSQDHKLEGFEHHVETSRIFEVQQKLEKIVEEKFQEPGVGKESLLDFLRKLNLKTKQDILEAFEKNTVTIAADFMMNGYLNAENFLGFQSQYLTKNTQEGEDGGKNNTERMRKFGLKLTSSVDLTKVVDNRIKNLKYKLEEFILKGDENDEKIVAINTLIKDILEDEQASKEFLDLLVATDKEKGLTGKESLYVTFKNFAIAQNPSFSARFAWYDGLIGKDIPVREKTENISASRAYEDAMLGTNVRNVGATLLSFGDDKTVTYFDGKKRFLGLEGTSYLLEAETPSKKAFFALESAFALERQKLEPSIQHLTKILTLLTENKELFLKDKEKFEEFKLLILRSWGQEMKQLFGNDFFEKIEDFSQFEGTIKAKKEQLEKALVEKRKQYQDKLSQLSGQIQIERKERDARLKEVLTFFHSIGFDQLPKSLTDAVIREINAIGISPSIGGITFETQIDIKKGILGVSDMKEGIGEKEKTFFIQLFNKMLTGSIGDPMRVEGGKVVSVKVGKEWRSDDIQGNIVRRVGLIKQTITQSTIMENLRKTNSDTL